MGSALCGHDVYILLKSPAECPDVDKFSSFCIISVPCVKVMGVLENFITPDKITFSHDGDPNSIIDPNSPGWTFSTDSKKVFIKLTLNQEKAIELGKLHVFSPDTAAIEQVFFKIMIAKEELDYSTDGVSLVHNSASAFVWYKEKVQ